MRVYTEVLVPGYGFVNYVDTDFTCYYAPDVVRNLVAAYPYCTKKKQAKLKAVLEQAKEAVAKWEIRDDIDARDQRFVLEASV